MILIQNLLKSKDQINYISNLTVNELETIIIYAADKYYNTSKPILSDDLYDILIDFLKIKNPKSKILKHIGSKVKGKNKVKLDYWLGSMNKIKPDDKQLTLWTNKYKPPYHISDKLDGISSLLVYKNNTINMFTRGEADEGLNISHLIKYLNNIPSYETINYFCNKYNLKGNKNIIAFRGELIMKEEIFLNKWNNKFKTARNCVSGVVNSKKLNPDLIKDIDLIIYEVVDPFNDIIKQFDIIKKLNFNFVHFIIYNDNLTFNYLSNYLKERRYNNIYKTDGIIITSTKLEVRNIKDNPEYAFAYKDILEEQKGISTIIDIEWNVSKNGFINPTIIINPINIGGIQIKRVTGKNAKFICDNKLGIGAIIEIVRSGDVIPNINKIIKPAEKVLLPKEKYHWNESKVDIILDNINDNEEILIKNINHFFTTLKTKGLGEKNIIKLVNNGYNSIEKILGITYEELLNIKGFKLKSSQNLVNAIKLSITNISLYKIMVASNKLGHGIGEEKIKLIINTYPNLLLDYKKWTKNDFIENLNKINGWDTKTSTLFVSNFNNFITFYKSILKYIKISENKVINNILNNIIVVFTGFRDKELKEKIELNGGKVLNTISKNTNYLIIKDNEGSHKEKYKKALELNINIILKNDFIKKFNL